MKDWELAEDLLTVCAVDPIFADASAHPVTAGACVNAQSAADYARPCYVFHVRTKPLDAAGQLLSFRLAIDVQTDGNERDADDNRVADVRHAARVSAMNAKFYAEGAAADLKTALELLGHFTLHGYDAGTEETDVAIEPTQFETPVIVAGMVRLV